MVRVVGVEAVQDQLLAVGLAVLVVVDEQGEVGLLGQVHAFGRDLEADGQVQAVGEYAALVGAAVAVGVLEDEELVVGRRVAGAVVRVGRRGGDPEAALAVEGHLHGLLQVGEHRLIGEEVHLEAGQELHLGDGLLTGEELGGIAVLVAGLVVGRDRRQGVRLRVIDGQVGATSGGDVLDERVAQGGHLADLADLVGVVLGAEGVVALAVGVDAVDDGVVGVPPVVLLLHGGVDQGLVGLRLAGGGTVERIGHDLGGEAVAVVGGGEAVDGVIRRAFGLGGIGVTGGAEEVDEGQAVLLGDAAHGLGVGGEAFVLLLAVGQVALLGEVLEGEGRGEGQARGALSVVGAGERMHHEGVQFGLVVLDATESVEGLVVSEEGHDGAGLYMEEPLVRGGEEALAVVLRVFGAELLGAGESPLAGARGMRAEGGGVARAAEVANDEAAVGEAELQLGLDAAVVSLALGETVADEGDRLALAGRLAALGALHLRLGRILSRGVRGGGALAVVGPVGGVGLVGPRLQLVAVDGYRLGGDQAAGEQGEEEPDGGLHGDCRHRPIVVRTGTASPSCPRREAVRIPLKADSLPPGLHGGLPDVEPEEGAESEAKGVARPPGPGHAAFTGGEESEDAHAHGSGEEQEPEPQHEEDERLHACESGAGAERVKAGVTASGAPAGPGCPGRRGLTAGPRASRRRGWP